MTTRTTYSYLSAPKMKKLTLAIFLIFQASSLNAQESEAVAEDVAELSDIEVTDDPRRMLPREPSNSTFGFNKPLLETPRSVSKISSETIDLLGLSAVEDLVQVVPGVFTTTRFGIQGNIDVRNVSADTYFRGMKRVNLQGHTRSVLAAMDTIEVVKGPPSPIYGMGKIGGYTNMVPKSGRASDGAYLLEPEGFAQSIAGSFERSEVSFGVGGPLSVGNKSGGYYIYGLIEDSGTYMKDVDVKQKIIQFSTSLDEFAGPFRLESGINFQRSETSGALTHRVTQELVDDGIYIRGKPLVNLDLNGDGKIGYYELHEASPTQGNLSGSNEPLDQYFAWPTDSNGNYLAVDKFPSVSGIPESLYNYLQDNPEADPGGLLVAQGVGGPLPRSGWVPVGMALDPRTTGYDDFDFRRAGAYERELQADLTLAYFDLIYDSDPNFTMKNQLFYDNMDQYKLSEQPGGGKQDITVIENKFTITKRITDVPAWLRLNTLASVNIRRTKSTGYRFGGDFSSHRTDLMAQEWPMTPNTTHASPFEFDDLEGGGNTWTTRYRTVFSEMGLGVLFDVDLFDKTNLLLGGRYDTSDAENIEYAGTFNATRGTSEDPGEFRTADRTNEGSDSGASWSVSLSHQLPFNIRPYITLAESSLMLDSNNNRLGNGVIEEGHIGSAELTEFGVKASMFNNRAFFSMASYEQTRTNVSFEDEDVLGADVSSTRTEGIEAEIKFVPVTNMFVSLYAVNQETTYEPNTGGSILVNARLLGFEDVLDQDGNVVYPAEAFLYGGRSRLVLPDGFDEYDTKQGNPETQYGFSANYQLNNGLGFLATGNYFSSTYSGRLRLVELPAVTMLNLGVFFDVANWHFRLNVRNATDERWFRARTGDTLGDSLIQSMPGRTWQITARANF